MTGNAAWLLICRIAADALNLLLFILISRTFGPEGTGMYAYGFAIASFLYAATTIGIEDYAVREYSHLAPEKRVRLLEDMLGAQICVTVIALAVLGGFIAITQPKAELLSIIVALSIYQLSAAFATTLFVPAMAEQKMMLPAVSTFAARACAFILAAIIIWIGVGGLSAALYAFAFAGMFLCVLAVRSARTFGHGMRAHIALAVLKHRAPAMWSFASVDLTLQVIARVSVIALTLLVSEQAAGVYATGIKLIEAACLPLLFLSTAAYPALCKAHHQQQAEFVVVTRRLLWFNVFAGAAIAVSMYWLVPRLLVPVFGARYAGTELIIASMAVVAFGQAVELIPGRILFAANQHISRAVRAAGAALLAVVLNVVLILQWGLKGAIAATSITYVVLWLLYQQALHRERQNLLRSQALAGGLA